MDKGYPWDSYQGDIRTYGAQDLANAFKRIIKNGVVDRENDFIVTPKSGNVVRIGTGSAWINGHTVSTMGVEEIEIPWTHTAWDENEIPINGILVLRIQEDTEKRNFCFAYKPPTQAEDDTGFPVPVTPSPADNEIEIAGIVYNRGQATFREDDIIQSVKPAACVNSATARGDETNVSGILVGRYGKIEEAKPGRDYMPPSGGTFTGKIKYNGAEFQTIAREKAGDWIIEKYQDGYVRASCVKDIGEVWFSRCTAAPIYKEEGGGIDVSFPIKLTDPMVQITGVGRAPLLCDEQLAAYEETGDAATIHIGRWYLIYYIDPSGSYDYDSSSTRVKREVKALIRVEGHRKD